MVTAASFETLQGHIQPVPGTQWPKAHSGTSLISKPAGLPFKACRRKPLPVPLNVPPIIIVVISVAQQATLPGVALNWTSSFACCRQHKLSRTLIPCKYTNFNGLASNCKSFDRSPSRSYAESSSLLQSPLPLPPLAAVSSWLLMNIRWHVLIMNLLILWSWTERNRVMRLQWLRRNVCPVQPREWADRTYFQPSLIYKALCKRKREKRRPVVLA